MITSHRAEGHPEGAGAKRTSWPMAAAIGIALVSSGCSESQPCPSTTCEAGEGADGGTDSGVSSGSDAGTDGGPGGGLCGIDSFVDREIGGGLADEVRDVAFVGGLLVAVGYEGGTLRLQNLEPGGDAKGFASYRDATGQEVRRVEFSTGGSDVVEALTIGPIPDHITVLGRTTGSLVGVNAGQFDEFLAIVDGSGTVSTLVQSGTERPQHPTALGWRGNTLFVAGYDDVYVPTNYVESWEDGYVERWTFAADTLSQDFRFEFRSDASDFLYGLAVPQTADAPIYVSGMLAAGTNKGPFVRATSATDGSELWRGRVGSVAIDNADVVMLDPDGNLLLAGSSSSTFGTPRGQQDAFLLRIDAKTGALLASTSDGSAGSDWVTAAARDASGNVYVAGETLGAVEGDAPRSGEADMFVLRFDSSFTLTGRWQSGRDGDESLTGIVVDSCGRVLVSGWIDGEFVPGQARGGRDGVLARVVF